MSSDPHVFVRAGEQLDSEGERERRERGGEKERGGGGERERERERVSWCFTPSQPVRLHQGDTQLTLYINF